MFSLRNEADMDQEYICPNCKNIVYDDEALLCHFCGDSLHRASNGALGQLRYRGNQIWTYGISIFVLLSVAVYFLR